MPVVVVGIDGSQGADAAFEFAAEEARLRGAVLRVVCAWEVPPMVYSGVYAPSTISEDLEKDAHKVIEDTLARIQLPGEITVEPRVVNGQAAEAILRAAEGADQIVVGSRGRGGFRSLVLGSVSLQIAHHAEVPVSIVPHPS